jgi:hypothetical protein
MTKFKVGQVWETRDGTWRLKIRSMNHGRIQGVYVDGVEFERLEDGTYCGDGREHCADITRLISDVPDTFPFPESHNKQPESHCSPQHHGDCECHRAKFGFTWCERWCPSYVPVSVMMARVETVEVKDYRTDWDRRA